MRRGLHILSITLEQQLKRTLEAKKQAIFLLNRRGYAHYLMCPRCDWVLMCDNCDATMVVHRTKSDEQRVMSNEIGKGVGQGGKETRRQGEVKEMVAASVQPRGNKTHHSSLIAHHSIQGTVQCHYCLTTMVFAGVCVRFVRRG